MNKTFISGLIALMLAVSMGAFATPKDCGEEFDVNSTSTTCQKAKDKGEGNADNACRSWFPNKCPNAERVSDWEIINEQPQECTVHARFICFSL